MNDLINQVNSIINTLENPGMYCYDCEHSWDGVDDGIPVCPECGSTDCGAGSGLDYLKDALDIEYTVSSSKEYLGARVLVALGGPNIWIDTRYGVVEGAWWQDSFSQGFVDNIGIDDATEELFNCL